MKIEIYRTYRRSKPYEQAAIYNSYEYRWRMRADNGRVVSQSSEGYLEPRNLVRGLEIAMPGWEMVVSGSTDRQVYHCYLFPKLVIGLPHIPVTVPEGTESLWAARRKR